MAEFTPDPPPLVLPDAPDVLSPNIPLNPPMVGEASPWIHVDGENRDIVLESIRAWVRHTLLPWTTSWQAQLTAWEIDAEDQLNAWMVLADTYITDHAIAGLSFRSTETAIAGAGTTDVTLVVDTAFRPIAIGDLVLSVAAPGNYGIVTALIDDTHATVTFIGSLLGPAGYSWRTTDTPIAGAGSTNVTVAVTPNRPLVIRDLIVDSTSDSNYGIVNVVIDDTHATVSFVGSLRGADGPQGDPGTNGSDGLVTSIVAGANITVDSTDPAHPIVSSSGGISYYTDTTFLRADITTPPGALAIVANESQGLITSLWVRAIIDGTPHTAWTAIQLRFASNDPADWAATVTWLNLLPLQLILDGSTAVEAINGLQLQWSPTNEVMQEPAGYSRFPVSGVNSDGTVTPNPDNSVSVVGSTIVHLPLIAAGWAEGAPNGGINADTDEIEIHITGKLATNGIISMRLATTAGPATFAYASFATTLLMIAGALTHPADESSAYNSSGTGRWNIASDTTNSPTYLDAVIKLRHTTEENDAVLGEYVSYYYDDKVMNTIFKRSGNLYFYGQGFWVATGVQIQFGEAFTGTIKVRTV